MKKLTSWAFRICGSFWVLNQSYWLSKSGENWRKNVKWIFFKFHPTLTANNSGLKPSKLWHSYRWTCIKSADKFCCCIPPGARDHIYPTSDWSPNIDWLSSIDVFNSWRQCFRSAELFKYLLGLTILQSYYGNVSTEIFCYPCSKCISVLKESGPIEGYHDLH